MGSYFVYIITNRINTVLYTGFTGDLVHRVCQHKSGTYDGFSKKYKCHKLVWYDEFPDAMSAIEAEKRIKKWKREYKINLITKLNPEWRDLYLDII